MNEPVRALVVERDAKSPTGWCGNWLVEQDGRVEVETRTPVVPQEIVDTIDGLHVEGCAQRLRELRLREADAADLDDLSFYLRHRRVLASAPAAPTDVPPPVGPAGYVRADAEAGSIRLGPVSAIMRRGLN